MAATKKVSIFEFDNYQSYLLFYVRSLNQRRGTLKTWAENLRVHATLISQVMNGKRDLNEEQAFDLSLYLGHSDLERDYFMELVRHSRSGSQTLRKFHQKNILKIRKAALNLTNRILPERKLSEVESSIFYSSWIYSAIRLYCSIGPGATLDEIVDKFKLERDRAVEVLDFLRSAQLLKLEGVRHVVGDRQTHLSQNSAFLVRHHANWRIKTLQSGDRVSSDELMYTAPFSISEKDYVVLREKLVLFIQEFLATVKETDPEIMACFNLDLIRL